MKLVWSGLVFPLLSFSLSFFGFSFFLFIGVFVSQILSFSFSTRYGLVLGHLSSPALDQTSEQASKQHWMEETGAFDTPLLKLDLFFFRPLMCFANINHVVSVPFPPAFVILPIYLLNIDIEIIRLPRIDDE